MCDCKKECDFEYGEKLQFADNEFYTDSKTRKFWGYQPNSEWPYSDVYGNHWKYARRPLPDIKPGHPIMVLRTWGWHISTFKRFSSNGGVCETIYGYEYEDWKILPGYDYTQPPPIEVTPWHQLK